MRPGTPGFVGSRLKEAREARELTALALADLLGVSRQAVSQYENGVQSPAPMVMRRATELLRLPYHYFIAPSRQEDPGVIFFRSLESATKSARLRMERRLGWLRDIVHYLRNQLRFPKVDFPDLDMPEDPSKISDRDIEDAAAGTRKYWGLKEHAISNVTWLIENKGGIVSRHDLDSGKLDAFSKWSDGLTTPYFVLGSDKLSAVRSRFNVAHELGHMILHKNVKRETHNNKSMFEKVEKQANRFAGAFLLPERTFSREFLASPSLDRFLYLKPLWKASIQFMIVRCSDLEIITPEQRTRLLANVSARGWRKEEPLDRDIQPEIPYFLRRSIETLVDRKVVAPSEIPFRLRLDARDIEDLACLDEGYFGSRSDCSETIMVGDDGEQSSTDMRPEILKFPWAR